MSFKKAILTISLISLIILACSFPLTGRSEEGSSEVEETVPEESAELPASTRPPQPTVGSFPEGPMSPTSLNVPLRVYNSLDQTRAGEPVTSGVPLPSGMGITDPGSLQLVDESGNPVAAQFTALARWGGSPDDTSDPLRWVLVDFQPDVAAQESVHYFLQEGGPGPEHDQSLVITDGADAVTIDTGVAQFSISKTDGSLTAPHLSEPMTGRAVGADGTVFTTSGAVDVEVTLSGPMRSSVEVKGSYQNENSSALLDYTSRYWFYAGQSSVRLFSTVENNNLCPLAEYSQLDCYDIGTGGSVDLADISLVLSTDLDGEITYQAAGESQPASGSLTADLLLYQDSSGTDHWDQYPTLVDWENSPLDTSPRMQTYVTLRGYLMTLGDTEVESGNQAAGWLSVAGDSRSWSVGVRDFWQNFPKALRAAPDGNVEIGLFPDEFGGDGYSFNLRAGEHKTHEIWLAPDSEIGNLLDPMFVQAPPEWYVYSGGFGMTALRDWDDWAEHEQYIDDQITTSPDKASGWEQCFDNLIAAVEGTDFYGIFDYGDWPQDYEGFEVAPLNSKYDWDYGVWLQWARGGDTRWFGLAEAAGRHGADIDILHNLHSPRHWGDGIIFGHSYHDEDGFTNPHRNFGGASPDTAYGINGMLLTYYLTGYEKAYETALELADCIEYRVHNDYNLCDFFPAGECSGEGYALGEGMYDAGCRPAANSFSIAVAAYRATGDLRYLTVADAIVNWGRAEDQPYISGPTGEEQMMRPWMLNMYLRILADYLQMREEFGLDDTYDAGASYLAYADWLRTYAWLDLDPIENGSRAAYPYEWWFDEREGDPNDEWSAGNNVPSINNWLLVGADAMAYAYHLSGEADYLERAETLFRTGSHDPFFVDDLSMYTETKQTINSIVFGNIFLYEWANQQ